MRTDAFSRRKVLQGGAGVGGALALGPLLGGAAQAATEAPLAAGAAEAVGKDVYGRIGVRPLINGQGTFTILSGSLMLPEVRAAVDAAARHYVHLDELAEAVGARLGELTGAEFGLVSSGCAAALTHAASACVAGGNPDLHVRIPDLTGFRKTEVIIPKHSRNVYEAAVSATGLKVVEVETVAELKRALGPRTALVYIMAMPRVDESELDTATVAALARPASVPVLVDAAAEILTIPNVHLKRGADLVAYSGGKCLRGPQSAGMLLGRKDLVRAAWVHSAPHHGFARGFKVGKEQAIGMLAAVEMWVRRDHEAEYEEWTSWLKSIARRVTSVAGVRTRIVQPEGLSNRTPSLTVLWNGKKLGVSGETVRDTLLEGTPRIAINAASDEDERLTGVSVTPYMMERGDARVIGEAVVKLLRDPPAAPPAPKPPSVDASGTWALKITYAAGESTAHELELTQREGALTGTHRGEFAERDASGKVSGRKVSVHSFYGEEHGDSLDYTFAGSLKGDRITGTVDMGEYLKASFTATRTH